MDRCEGEGGENKRRRETNIYEVFGSATCEKFCAKMLIIIIFFKIK